MISLGKKEISDIVQDGEDIELNCHFCNSNYVFTVDELQALLNDM